MKPRGNDWALLCLPLVTCIAVRKWEQAGAKMWDAFSCLQNQQHFCPCSCKTVYNILRQIKLELYDIANVKINGDWSTFGRETLSRLDITLVLTSVGSPRSCCQGEQRAVHLSCLCPPTLWWQQNYCTLWENFEVKNFNFLFFTSLLLPLQFHLSYKLCTVCPLEIVWFLGFMLSKSFFLSVLL